MAVYKCDVCDKIFTEKRNLLRHEKNTHGGKNSYSCEWCNKVYGRIEHLRRHKASTHYRTTEVQCSKCKKTFARADNLKRHKCKLTQEVERSPDSNEDHSNDMTTKKMFPGKTPRPDAPPTNDKSFDEPPIKKRCFKPDQHKVLESEELTESDPEVKDFMQKYWGSIRSFTKEGKIQNIYNIFYDRGFKDLIETITKRIMTYQKNRFKINYSLGFILKNIETKELRYYHASFNNAQILETALLINNQKDLKNFLHSLAEESFYDGLTRPDTKWKVVQISNITFYANSLKDAPLGAGASLPSYITNNHGLANVSGNDNLCFFDVWPSIKELIDIGVNVKPKNCLMIIACILILFPTLLLV